MNHNRGLRKQWLRWQKGRQQSGYDKMLLAYNLYFVPFDLYLLRFPQGSQIAPHIDQVKQGRHFRLNVVIKKSKQGGDFICDQVIYENSRIKLFRSDIAMHAVTPVEQGTRYVLSLGWIY